MVAAVPSLHSAFTALVAMFLWARVRRPRLRPLLALYPLAMGLTLIATGEHYFFDVLLGWLYAGAVMLAWSRWERCRRPVGGGGVEREAGRNRRTAAEGLFEAMDGGQFDLDPAAIDRLNAPPSG
jgi:membrane-associated phospholipid phosphatase